MIATGIESRVQIQQIVENQLPEFILSESPKASEFLKQYYVSQEFPGGTVDIIENLDQYLKLDNLTPEVIVGQTSLTSDVTNSSDVISVTSTKGFPNQYGLFKIDSEIITYTGLTTNTFTGCIRGFSGITTFHSQNNPGSLEFSTSSASSHESGSSVLNLSALFLKEFYQKVKYTLTPGLENNNFVSNLDVSNFIKESKTFYRAKGTEESFRILFNILYGVTPRVIDLERYLVKPSSANFIRREVVVAERISGDPNNLVGQTIRKSTDFQTQASVSEVEVISRKGKVYYKLGLFIGYDEKELIEGSFTIPGKTKVIGDVSSGSSVITVDSTIGFANSGTIVCGGNTITYTDKTINQFLNCSGINSNISSTTDLRSDENIYGYENGDLTKKVELRITGVLSNFVSINDVRQISEGEKIYIKNLGEKITIPEQNRNRKQVFANSWIYNTSSRFQVESISGTTYELYSDIDKSNLKETDNVEILIRGTETVVISNATVNSITPSTNEVTLDGLGGFSPSSGVLYDIRRKLNKANSSSIDIGLGNNILVSDVQNVYNENDKFFYVASNSLPSYTINSAISKISLGEANGSRLQGYNSNTLRYSILSFVSNVPFTTGDEIYYKPETTQMPGLPEGIYYVKVLSSKNQIKLYKSRSFIPIDDNIEFGSLSSGTGNHTFYLADFYDKDIEPQKILKKFPLEPNIKSGKSVETIPGSIGVLINGVEISNYKTDDKIYYGPIKELELFNGGSNYDVINPPTIQISTPSLGTTSFVRPVISGSVHAVHVDPQDFDIDKINSLTITGGNGNGAVLDPILVKRYREITFDARENTNSGGIDTSNETITFTSKHNLTSGQAIVYNRNGNNPVSIGTFGGSNANQNLTLQSGSIYYPEVVNTSSIKLYQTLTDYTSGINTVGFTTVSLNGLQKFRVYEGRNTISEIKVIDPGSGYTNRKLIVKTSGISTTYSTITFKNHGFSSGEKVTYSTTGTTISGLSTSNQYQIIRIDSDSFRLANAGVGGTITSNYTRKNYVKFGSVGSGYHNFEYPQIKVNINVEYGGVSGILTVTPVVLGSITDLYLYENGTGYGSDILNLEKTPTVRILNGKNARLRPIISSGSLVSVDIQSIGSEYTSVPQVEVVGDGIGAKVRVEVDNGRISKAVVLNGGVNYTEGKTYIKVIPAGSGCIINPKVRSLSVNKQVRFGKELIESTDDGLRYSFVGYSTDIGKEYFGDTGIDHSPIIGWAYDGNPIYGPYGHSDPSNLDSPIRLLDTGYSAKLFNVDNRPSGFDLGYFVEDYEFDNSGDLDENNGRYCKTPEYPEGTYAYFVGVSTSISGSLEPKFPYFIGNTYRSNPLEENFLINQNNFDFNSSNLIRNTYPYKVSDEYADNDFLVESNEYVDQTAIVDSVVKGSVETIEIIESGSGYKVGESVVVDNSTTNGGGLTASIRRITGKDITKIETTVDTYNNTIFVWKDPNRISAYISTSHSIEDGDNVTVSGLTTAINSLTGIHKVGVTTEVISLNKEISSNTTLGVVTDIYVSSIPNIISVGSSIGIGTETLSVINIFDDKKILRVKRGISGTAHTVSSDVNVSANFVDILVQSDYFKSKVNDTYYFNPHDSVGVGTLPGISTSVSYTLGETAPSVSVPSQSIYLPNHPFKTNQQVTFTKSPTGIGLTVSNTSGGLTFNLPSVSTETVYIINKSKDYIGIVTQVGLTTNTDGLFFVANGSNKFDYSIESNFNQVTGRLKEITSQVSVSTAHGLLNGDLIRLSIKSGKSVGIGTSTAVSVRYKSSQDRLVLDPVGFSSEVVNTSENKITLNSHGFATGDKVFYDSNSVCSGLSTGDYFVYRIDDNTIQLTQTRYDAINYPPNVVSLGSTGGSSHELGLINPPISIVSENNLVFDLSDSSLLGYDFKFFYDSEFKNEFVSTGKTDSFATSGVGTVGLSTNASITLNYTSENPRSLFYAIEKSGFISTSDVDVFNRSKITYIDSKYNGEYSVYGIGTTTFNISLEEDPESLSYTQADTNSLKYDTNSQNTSGGISDVQITFGGYGYKKLPIITGVDSENGANTKLVPKSSEINKINGVRIVDPGFEYASDKTLRPQAFISPKVSIINTDTITNVEVPYGGKNYTTPPDLIIVDPETRKQVVTGIVEPTLNGTSINSVNIVESPKGLSSNEQLIFAINNSNGVTINTINSTASGVATCVLITPISGFSTSPFTAGEKIFVEGIQKYGTSGEGYNSADHGYQFFTVKAYRNTNPAEVEFDISGITTNPGIAKTSQNSYASIVRYGDYPRFTVTQSPALFNVGEKLAVLKTGSYNQTDLTVVESGRDYIKVLGDYQLSQNNKLRGIISGTLGTVDGLIAGSGRFDVDYSSRVDYGWSDNTGKLSEDYQVLPDNDYYQSLSYTVKSTISFEDLINPVNRLLHTSGLKNFADTEVISKANLDIDSITVDSISIYDISDEKRVDTINSFDTVIDVDVLNNKSKFLKTTSKKLSSYVECKTNRVLDIENIKSKFIDSASSLNQYVDIPLETTYSRFLVQVKDTDNSQIQSTEVVVFKDSNDVYTLEKSSLFNTTEEVGEFHGVSDEFGNQVLRFTPTEVFDNDYDLKVFENSFNTDLAGISTQSIGFVNLIGSNVQVGVGSTSQIVSSSIASIEAYHVTSEVLLKTSNERNFVEMYLTHDGTNSYFSEYRVDSESTEAFSSNFIGTFISELDAGVLSLKFENNSSNEVLVRSKVVGFGTTASGIGTYRFKQTGEIDGNERSAKLESFFTNVSSASTIVGFSSSRVSTVKSLVRVSAGQTSAIHQLLSINNGSDTYITQYPFISIGSTSGIGTFSTDIDGSNFNIVFHPDASITGNIEVQSFNEVIYDETDLQNVAPELVYGSVTESLNVFLYNGVNGDRANKFDFELKYDGAPIFSKKFDPSDISTVDYSTGIFSIKDHFFNTGERLIYTPRSSFVGVPEIAVGIGTTLSSSGITTDILPSEVYAIRINKDKFRISTRSEYASSGIYVTFTSSGSGNIHELEMYKKNEKSLITLDGLVQSPLAFTPINTTLTDNGGEVSESELIFSISGISSITPTNILKVDNEYMKVTSVGLGTTSNGPITGFGAFNLVGVDRSFVGSSATSHTDGSSVRVYSGSYNIVGSRIYFTDPPKGKGSLGKDSSNLEPAASEFSGRVFLRQDYTNNRVFDDISDQFTGIGQTYTASVLGLNTTGIQTGSSILLLNGIFQTPTTSNNLNNNYSFTETAGISSFVFTGITSSNGSIIKTDYDTNQNQLPRGGVIVSLGSTGGLGIAPLVGASVTAIVGAGGTIVSVGIGTTDISGSGYRGVVSVGITESGHSGSEAAISATVGAGGTLSFTVTSPGSGYVNPQIFVSEPSYSNLSITGVSRLGIGATTDTGTGFKISVDVGAAITSVGIGSTLFEVTSFKVENSGYGFKVGDVFTPVGLVTAKGLSSPVSDFELTVLDVYSDKLSSWDFGEFDYIDSIKNLQDGVRTRFPLYYNNSLLSFEIDENDPDSSLIELNNLLLIFVNGVLQEPGESYNFSGGTSFIFKVAPREEDNISIFFYKGTSDVDSVERGKDETIKVGDIVQVSKSNVYPQTIDQDERSVYFIASSDTIETNLYAGLGIDETNPKPLNWTKQKVDRFINGDYVYKSRDSLEGRVFPTAKIINDISTSDNQIFVDDAQLFNYEGTVNFGGLIVSGEPLVAAGLSATVSSSGSIIGLNIISGGSGYVGSALTVSIAAPPHIGVGIGTTAKATVAISNGQLTSPITITNPGFGYNQSNPPKVIAPAPIVNAENVTSIGVVEGFSGIITGITTTTGTLGNPLALKFFLHKDSGSYVGLETGYPIYISDTTVGSGVTSIDSGDAAIVAVGTTFLDNIYYIHEMSYDGLDSEIVTNVDSGSTVVGIATTGSASQPIGKFSWGRLSGFSRSSNPISIGITGLTVDSGLTTYPTVQRRDHGFRSTGALQKQL